MRGVKASFAILSWCFALRVLVAFKSFRWGGLLCFLLNAFSGVFSLLSFCFFGCLNNVSRFCFLRL